MYDFRVLFFGRYKSHYGMDIKVVKNPHGGNNPKLKIVSWVFVTVHYGEFGRQENESLFNHKKVAPTIVVDIIKATTFLWFKDINKNGGLNWID
uniref:Uncharacterized protein n=1 Tax=Lactuca sativa TaxID=4236 RepID=A0A9R1VZF9_LACSA|nr:hypothetical protein LSAT_V11C300131740 [Lactuca sativa]